MCSAVLILYLSLLHSMRVKHMQFNSVVLTGTLTREKQKQNKKIAMQLNIIIPKCKNNNDDKNVTLLILK